MKILLLGKQGQVGWELQRALMPLGEVIALGREGQDGLVGDISDFGGLRATLDTLKPDVIVNAAAYTAVDRAEEETSLAHAINAEAPKILADAAKALNSLLVHYSTDYVFDGTGKMPWKESDTAIPINYYGVTKLAGEQAIQASGCRYLVFRTSWVCASRGSSFLATMLKLIQEKDTLQVVCDQVGVPTSAELIADVTAQALTETIRDPGKSGLYHLVASGETNWHDYASFIAKILHEQNVAIKATEDRILSISTTAYPTPAKRPANSRLNHEKIERTFGLKMPDWRQGVMRAIIERIEFQARSK